MKRFGKTLSGFTAVFTIFLGSSAMADHGTANEGRKFFTTYCYLCHGMNGKGDGPLAAKLKVAPSDLTNPKMGQKKETEIKCLIDGSCKVHGSGEMSKWSKFIPEPQMRAMAAYVRYLAVSKNPLIGNPDAGERIYEKYCSPCHGKKGKGDGIMRNVLSVKPADHTDAEKMDKTTNAQLIDTITNGLGKDSFMPGWGGILTETEIKDLVGYIRLLSH